MFVNRAVLCHLAKQIRLIEKLYRVVLFLWRMITCDIDEVVKVRSSLFATCLHWRLSMGI